MKRLIGLGLLALVIVACGSGPALNADAGTDFDVPMGEAPSFDGCASQGDIVDYGWTIVSTPGDMTADEGKALRATDSNCSFTSSRQWNSKMPAFGSSNWKYAMLTVTLPRIRSR